MSVHDETWDRPICEFCNKQIPYGDKRLHRTGKCFLSNPEPFANGEKAQARGLDGQIQVYGKGLTHFCFCDNQDSADLICAALNKYFDHD